MAISISRTWGEHRTVYAINFYNYTFGEGNLIFNAGEGGIHPSPPSSVLFRTTQFARFIFQTQPWFYINEVGTFALDASGIYGGLIPDREWAYFKDKSVTSEGEPFTISDDAQFSPYGQTSTGFPAIKGIEGFTKF